MTGKGTPGLARTAEGFSFSVSRVRLNESLPTPHEWGGKAMTRLTTLSANS